jgi:hypothetical protein
LLAEGHAATLVWNSALLGLSLAAACFLVEWRLPPLAAASNRRRWGRRVTRVCGSVSPLITGVGVLALLRLVDLAAIALRSASGWSHLAASLEKITILLDPYGSPSVLLFLGVCLAYLPAHAATSPVPLDRTAAARLVDQAILAGSPGKRAGRMALREGSARAAGRVVLWAILATTSVAPAILLAPTVDRGPIGPAIVRLASVPEASQAAARLALLALTANWTALALAAAGGGLANGSTREPFEPG